VNLTKTHSYSPQYTYEMMIQADDIGNAGFYQYRKDGDNQMLLRIATNQFDALGYTGNVEQYHVTSAANTNENYHAFVYAANDVRYRINDGEVGADTSVTVFDSVPTAGNTVGSNFDGSTRMDGVLDEVRISDIDRSDAWLSATYNNLVESAGFITFGNEQDRGTPSNSNPYPVNNSIGGVTNPTLRITVNDSQGFTMNHSFWTNESGSWLNIAWNNNTANATLSNSTTVFTDSITYWWSSNLSNENNRWDNDTYRFTVGDIPIQSGEAPSNESTRTDITPQLYVNCTADTGDTMNATWLSNSSGSLVQFASNTSISSGTNITQSNSNFSEYGTTYWWSVHLSDGTNWTNNTYHFTTNNPPVISNPLPANHSVVDVDETDITVSIVDPDGDTFNWTIETIPDIGTSNNNDDTDGTKRCIVNDTHNLNVTWFINCTDSYNWVNRTYNYTSLVEFVNASTDGSSVYYTGVQRLNLSWSGAARADNHTVVQRNDTYATSATQSGNWIRQNNSNIYVNLSWTKTSGGYFTIFSYNTSANMHSYNNETPLGLDIFWGAIAMSVFNESNASQAIIGWNVQISDSEGEDTYTSDNNSNILYIDLNDIPFGTDTIVTVSAVGYYQRHSFYDFVQNTFYNIVFYLPPYITDVPEGSGDPDPDTEEPGNTTETIMCVIRVIDEVEQRIPAAEITVKRYIDTTDSYETMFVDITDGDGEITQWLVPNVQYLFQIEKTNYTQVGSGFWTPTRLVYTKTFVLEYTEYIPQPPSNPHEYVFICGNSSRTNTTLYINFTDTLEETINSTIYIYEINRSTGTTTLFATFTNTSENTIRLTITGLNTNNSYQVIIYYNHTTFGLQKQTCIYEGYITTLTTPGTLNTIMTAIFGFNPLVWTHLLMFLFFVACMYFGDQQDSGKILIITGGLFIFINTIIGFDDALLVAAGGIIPTIFILVGILVEWGKGGGSTK